MQIDYQETTKDLLKRIDIHKQYGSRDIDRWMIDLLAPRNGSRILDVGCGSGKQCFLYHQYSGGTAEITGGDVNKELLAKARSENAKIGNPITFQELDFNQPFPFEDSTFDLESCCFAIYYASDIPATINEMKRVLKPGGRLFSTGPMPQNKQLFYDIIRQATGKTIPPMPGSSRYNTQILSAMQSRFSKVEVHLFENPLTFPEVKPFLEYTRASLDEDRKLWSSLFSRKDDFEKVMKAIESVAQSKFKSQGNLVMTKVVGGFVATK